MSLTDALNETDLTAETEATLLWAINQLQDEQARRAALATAESTIRDAQEAWRSAAGRTPGDPWVQPLGAHDTYPKGWPVTHAGKAWESLVDNNVWEPGVSGWREAVEDGAPEWVQPTGAHDAYQSGDRVRFEGFVWESLRDGNVWSPAVLPSGWRKVE